MTNAFDPAETPLRIQTPCPKRWDELSGSGAKRYCSECRLHVHDAAQLTKAEAQALVSSATSRVCMRMEYDAAGEVVFRDHRALQPIAASNLRGPIVRAARWAMTAAAGVLAACQGGSSDACSPTSPSNTAPTSTEMGKVSTTVLGDVATPPRIEKLGEVHVVDPPPSPTPPREETLGRVAGPEHPKSPNEPR